MMIKEKRRYILQPISVEDLGNGVYKLSFMRRHKKISCKSSDKITIDELLDRRQERIYEEMRKEAYTKLKLEILRKNGIR